MTTKTKAETIDTTIYIHACPPYEFNDEQQARGYRIDIDVTNWDSRKLAGYVLLAEVIVPVDVPGGIDVLNGFLDGLKNEQKELRAECENACTKIERQIQSMLAISHQPEEV